jgi:eukaryotic-like serine/threonine-protein kinase
VKTCPVCSREFPDNVKFCPNDGQTLRAKGPLADLVGQVVADRYHIIKKLGEGGMGTVYLGEHVKMGRKSAIKVMTQAMSNDPDAVSRFNREAANASRLSHPNICQVYDFGETTDGLIYLAMEFIEGRSLSGLVESEGALPPARAASIVKQAADALQVAHDQTIVHRDIKPDNIMVIQAKDGSDVVKVVDFGIAKAVAGDETGQKVTKTGLVVGTPEYMSPEQLSGDKLDGRSDIYSLALVLYKLLTGVLPFQADTAQETMIKRLTDDPEPLAVARPDIAFPEGLQAVMDRALARTVDQRYGSAAEFGRDLAAAVAALPLPQTRVNIDHVTQAATQLLDTEMALKAAKKDRAAPVPPAARPAVKRFPLVPVTGGVGAVAVLAVIGWLAMGRKQAPTLPATDTTQHAATQDSQGRTPGPQTSQNRAGTGGQAPEQPRRQATPGTPRQTALQPGPQPGGTATQPSSGGGFSVADTLAHMDDLVDASQWSDVRRVGLLVWGNPTSSPAQKARAARAIATAYASENNTEDQITWLRNSLRYDSSSPSADRVRGLLTQLGVTP